MGLFCPPVLVQTRQLWWPPNRFDRLKSMIHVTRRNISSVWSRARIASNFRSSSGRLSSSFRFCCCRAYWNSLTAGRYEQISWLTRSTTLSPQCGDRGKVRLCILIEVTHWDFSYSAPFGVSGGTSLVKQPTDLMPRSMTMGETSIAEKQ